MFKFFGYMLGFCVICSQISVFCSTEFNESKDKEKKKKNKISLFKKNDKKTKDIFFSIQGKATINIDELKKNPSNLQKRMCESCNLDTEHLWQIVFSLLQFCYNKGEKNGSVNFNKNVVKVKRDVLHHRDVHEFLDLDKKEQRLKSQKELSSKKFSISMKIYEQDPDLIKENQNAGVKNVKSINIHKDGGCAVCDIEEYKR